MAPEMQKNSLAFRESPSAGSSASPLSSSDANQPLYSLPLAQRSARQGHPHLEGTSMASFYPPHDLGSVSPHEGGGHLGENLRPAGSGSGTPSPAQISVMMMHNPKRAYRQRRKDPSCDACRERKVKCDATETSSCTECSSRNVRCQFTKDTNRRMSSIKQVQDLERQLMEARQQLDRLRASEQQIDLADDMRPESSSSVFTDFPSVGKSPRRMLKARSPQDLSYARAQLNDIGRGLLKPPVTGSQHRSHSSHGRVSDLSGLPSQPAAERLLHYYRECVHRQFPVLHWPSFQQNFGIAMEGGSTETLPIDWIATFWGVLACGALATHDPGRVPEAQEYLTRSISTINFWEDDVSTNQAIVAFLASFALMEMNRKSASWIWLGSAIRIVQDLGLHVQGGQWSPIEGEMRKRLWYSLYVWDRLISLELGKPMLINDDECDTEYPEALDEERLGAEETDLPLPSTLLLSSVHLARLLALLAKMNRSLCITNEALAKFESHLGECLQLYPRPLMLASSSSIDPCIIAPLLYFQNTRLLLHRHNISPSCSPEQRAQAIEQCVHAARDTVGLLVRCMVPHVQSHEWEQRFVLAATTLLCTHLWRCMLLLLFRQQYDAFFILLRASSTIGNARPINICCGRNISFFVRRLIERFEQQSFIDLDQDEEILVYLSADLQASTNSWVWGNAETGTHLSRRQKHGRPKHIHPDNESHRPDDTRPSTWDNVISEQEQRDWGGWSQVERSARYLKQLRESRQQSPQSHFQSGLPPRPSGGHQQQTFPSLSSQGPVLAPISPGGSQNSDPNRAKMTIANIL